MIPLYGRKFLSLRILCMELMLAEGPCQLPYESYSHFKVSNL